MSAITQFVDAAGAVVEGFMTAMPQEDQARIGGLVAAGNGLSISMVVQSDGSATVLFEVILSDGSRRTLAHICAAQPTAH